MTIAQRLDQIRATLPPSVRLIAVTKQVSPEIMRQAYEAGIRDFGENRLQEALVKQEQLHDLPDICWHFIGHLQTNKVKKALEHFHWIHSLDNLKLAQSLHELARESSISPQVCLQVKMLPDPNKYGWSAEELVTDLPQLKQYSSLQIQGLMTILPLGLSPKEILATFQKTADLAHKIEDSFTLPMPELSMGMSDDYLLAVQAGATMIRLGRIIFGERTLLAMDK